jgi:SAM-dependent methyltransferase
MVGMALLKDLNQQMWSAGDYPEVAKLTQDGAVALVDRLDITAGTRVLDLATGNGNVALLAAGLGATVTGLDLTDAYFADARRRADAAGVHLELVLGDVEALTFADATFDVVTSTYGAQFAPRHEVVAAELARVCRPGGLVGMCNWTQSGWTGRFQDIIALYFPDPPAYVRPPMLWGDPDYVTDLLGPEFEVHTEPRRLTFEFAGPDELVGFFEDNFGPCLIAKQSISPRSRWPELRAELVAMTAEFFTEGRAMIEPEYLLVVARKVGR